MDATATKHDLNSQSHRVTHRVKLLGRLAGTARRRPHASRPNNRLVRRPDDAVRLGAVRLPEVLAELGRVMLEALGRPRLEGRQGHLARLRGAVGPRARLGQVLLCARRAHVA